MTEPLPIDVTAILTVHAEGIMAGMSFRSLMDAADYAQSRGLVIEVIVVMDNPDRFTLEVFGDVEEMPNVRAVKTNFGDQGKVRNQGVQEARGKYVAFLDGDDLWSENWLYRAGAFAKEQGDNAIVHPEFNWFFGGISSILIGMDQDHDWFQEDYFRFGNYWDAMCLTSRSVHLQYPYCERNIEEGFAYEDWHWNCITMDAGCRHLVVPTTIHFKRRRERSQTSEASATRAVTPYLPYNKYEKVA